MSGNDRKSRPGDEAYIQVFTEGASIFLIDSFGNRYAVSVEYTLKPLFKTEEINWIYMDYTGHTKLLLYLYDHYSVNRVMSRESIELRKHVLQIPGLRESYYVDCLVTIIDYYYENYDAVLLEKYFDAGFLKVRARKESGSWNICYKGLL